MKNKIKWTIVLILLMFSVVVKAQDHAQYIQILMFPQNNSWDCIVGEKQEIKVAVLKDNIPLNNIKINYSYGLEGMDTESSGSLIISDYYINIPIGSLMSPGFKRCVVTVIVDDIKYSNSMTFAFSPELIKPTVKEPSDFDVFWRNAIKETRDAQSIMRQEILDDYSTANTEVSKIYFQVPRLNINIYGYLSKPRKDGKYPILLYLPGAGIRNSEPLVEFMGNDIITLSLEIHGIDPQLDKRIFQEISNAFVEYKHLRVEDKDDYYYKRVILGCVKAADFLSDLPEYDGKNFAVFGGSQGGYLSIATASLHDKISCLVSFHPGMADLTGYLNGRVGGWPHFSRTKMFNIPEIVNTLSYYDCVNFAKRIDIPGFYSFGYNDRTCPPTTGYAVVNSINADKTLFITPLTGHWRIPEMMTKSKAWIRNKFK